MNIVKPRFLLKTVDIWSYIMPFDINLTYPLKNIKLVTFEYFYLNTQK